MLVSQLGSFSSDLGTCLSSPRPHPWPILGCVLFPSLYNVLRLVFFVILFTHFPSPLVRSARVFSSDWEHERSTSVIVAEVPLGMNLSLRQPHFGAPRHDQSGRKAIRPF